MDCGGDCPSCAIGKHCGAARDCLSGLCAEGVCAERDIDTTKEPPPAGYDVRTASSDSGATARRAGILFFGVGYGAAYVSALTYPARLSWMYAPVLGPWLTLGQVDEKGYKGLLIADGAFQAAGALILIGGIASGGKQLVRSKDTAVHVLPVVSSQRQRWTSSAGSSLGFWNLETREDEPQRAQRSQRGIGLARGDAHVACVA